MQIRSNTEVNTPIRSHVVITSAICGDTAKAVRLECLSQNGLPKIMLAGVKQSKFVSSITRIRSMLKAILDIKLNKKFTLNFNPNLEDVISVEHMELPIAIALTSTCKKDNNRNTRLAAIGNISLLGNIEPLEYFYPLLLALLHSDAEYILVPWENLKGFKINDARVIGISNFTDILDTNGNVDIDFNKLRGKYVQNYYKEPYEEHQQSDTLSNGNKILNDCIIDNNEEGNRDNNDSDFIIENELIMKMMTAICGKHNILVETNHDNRLKSFIDIFNKIFVPEKMDLIDRALIELCKKSYAYSTNSNIFRRNNAQGQFIYNMVFLDGTESVKEMLVSDKNIGLGYIYLAHKGILCIKDTASHSTAFLRGLCRVLGYGDLQEDRENRKSRYGENVKLSDYFSPLCIFAMKSCKCGGLYSNAKRCSCSLHDIYKYRQTPAKYLKEHIKIYINLDDLSTDLEEALSLNNLESIRSNINAAMRQRKNVIRRGNNYICHNRQDRNVENIHKTQMGEVLYEEKEIRSFIKTHEITDLDEASLLDVATSIMVLNGKEKINQQELMEAANMMRIKEYE